MYAVCPPLSHPHTPPSLIKTHRLLADAQATARDAAADHATALTQLDALRQALTAREQQLQDANARVQALQQAQQRAEQSAASRERNLLAQVEQLEDEMARCQADKARAVAQAQDAEHVHQHLRGLLDQAQEQTEAILAEFHEGDEDQQEGVPASAPATARGRRVRVCFALFCFALFCFALLCIVVCVQECLVHKQLVAYMLAHPHA